MERAEVMKKVIQAVVQVQEASGRQAGTISSSTRPVRDAGGFDSLSGVEATVMLSESLGHELPDDNVFVSADGRRALSIAEATEKLCKIIGVERAANERPRDFPASHRVAPSTGEGDGWAYPRSSG